MPLPGLIPFVGVGPTGPTYGVDRFTVSLLKFDEFVTATAMGAGQTVKDFAKPSRTWASNGANGVGNGCYWFAGGASGYCDGSGYYSPIDDVDYQFGSGDFTIDLYVLPNNTTQTGYIIGWNYGFGPWVIFQNTTTYTLYASSNGTSWDIANGVGIATATAGAWTHIAVQRKAGVWTTWGNGTQVNTFTNAAALPTPTAGQRLWISPAIAPWGGYVDEIRFSKGTARYTGTFTPPRSPYYGTLSGYNDAATKLLLHFDSDVNDRALGLSVQNAMVLRPAGAYDTSIFKFGGAALKNVNVNNEGAYAPQSKNFDVRAGDWTIDYWIYRTSTVAGNIVAKRNSGAAYAPFAIASDPTGIIIYASVSGTAWDAYVGNVLCNPSISAWHHVAHVKTNSNNMLTTYLDGVQASQFAWSSGTVLWMNSDVLSIGGLADYGGLNGRIDEFRFSDVARWTANFTPPAGPYAPDAPVTKTVTLTSGSAWVVPADWNNANNTIETYGAGGGGGGANGGRTVAGNGGAGGAFSRISNLALTPGNNITFAIGAPGPAGVNGGANGGDGGDTWFNGASLAASSVGAKGGQGGITGGGTAALGGAAASGVGTLKKSGGNGGVPSGMVGGGGGGAGGPTADGGAASGTTAGTAGGGLAGIGGVGGNPAVAGPFNYGGGGCSHSGNNGIAGAQGAILISYVV